MKNGPKASAGVLLLACAIPANFHYVNVPHILPTSPLKRTVVAGVVYDIWK